MAQLNTEAMNGDGEVISGEVGRSFIYDGIVYWMRSADDSTWEWDAPDAEDHIRVSNWDSDKIAWRLRHIGLVTSPVSRIKITGIY